MWIWLLEKLFDLILSILLIAAFVFLVALAASII